MSQQVTSPPILDSTGLAIVTALDGIQAAAAAKAAAVKASYDESPALYSHAVNDYVYFNDHLYKVTQAISIGNVIAVGTNITATTGIPAGTPVFVENLPDGEQ